MSHVINGQQIFMLMEELFPVCRSITGDGLRQSFEIIKRVLPELHLTEVPTGTECFDWKVPMEWRIEGAELRDPQGDKVVDFKDSNLHVVNYSSPVDIYLNLEELQSHLYSIPEVPNAIPYVTSYFSEGWGFCLAHEQREKLRRGKYHAKISSAFIEGSMTLGSLLIKGSSENEVLLSSYLCHPSLANNELSGPSLLTYLARWILTRPRRYTYRVVLVPETIGTVAYLSKNLSAMKRNTIAGFVLTCLGDSRSWSHIESRNGNTLADKLSKHLLSKLHPEFSQYSFKERGSDERQYCSPLVDLPVCTVTRSKFGTYPEYHNSNDNLSIINPLALQDSFDYFKTLIEALESNFTYRAVFPGEPQMSKRGLRSSIGFYQGGLKNKDLMNVLAYSTGLDDCLAVAEKLDMSILDVVSAYEELLSYGLVTRVDPD